MNPKLMISILLGMVLFGYLIFDGFYKDKAMKENVHLVKSLRAHRSTFLDYLMIGFSAILYSEVLIFILFLAFFLSRDKLNAVANMCYIVFGVYINGVSKLFYQQGRPWYVTSVTIIGKCEIDLGHPSGHSMMGMVLVILIIDWIIFESNLKTIPKRDIENGGLVPPPTPWKASYYVIYFFGSLYIFAIGLSRIYLGAHSYEQVLSGWCYGGLYLIYHYNWGKENTKEILVNLGNNSEIWKFSRTLTFIGLFLFACFALVFPIVSFVVFENEEKMNRFAETIFEKCAVDKYEILDRKILSDCGLGGMLIGVLFGAYFSNGVYYAEDVYDDSKPTLTFGQKFLRFIVYLSLFVVMLVIYLLVKKIEEAYTVFIIHFFDFTFLGFNIVFLMPIIYNKLGVNFKGDFLKYDDNRKIGYK